MASNDRHLEWERWDFPLELYAPSKGTPLPPNSTVVVERGDDLSLHLTATSGAAPVVSPAPAVGSLSTGEAFELATAAGNAVKVDGFFIRNVGRSDLGTPSETHTVEGSLESVRAGDLHSGAYRVLWLANMRADEWIWPFTTTRSVDGTFRRSRPYQDDATVQPPFANESFSRGHVSFEVGLPRCATVTIGRPSREHAPEELLPGMICLHEGPDGAADEEFSLRVQRVVGFCIGRATAVMGATTYGTNWVPVGVESRSAYLPRGPASFQQSSSPPAPLAGFKQGIDPARMRAAIVGMLRNYDALNLGQVIWQYQHALEAPPDMTPSYLRAAFEALRRAYFQDPARQSKTQLLPRPLFAKLRDGMKNTLRALRETHDFVPHSDTLDMIENKIDHLNQQPLARQTTLFLDELGLEWGDVEKDALRVANEGAHGRGMTPEIVDLFQYRTHALQALVSRAVLAAAGATETYFDFSTLGEPERNLREPLGGPHGDGKPA